MYLCTISYHRMYICTISYHKMYLLTISYHKMYLCTISYHKMYLCTITYHKIYLCTISYHKINKCNFRNSFCPLSSLVFFCWCHPYKRPTGISQNIRVTFAAVSIFRSGYILVKSFTVFVRHGCYTSQEKSKWDCRKWSFKDMLQPKARYENSRYSLNFLRVKSVKTKLIYYQL